MRRLDHILLETTGLADPAPLVSILWLDDQLEAAIKLDSIITVSPYAGLELKKGGGGLPKINIKYVGDVFFVKKSPSTSTTITWTFYYINAPTHTHTLEEQELRVVKL